MIGPALGGVLYEVGNFTGKFVVNVDNHKADYMPTSWGCVPYKTKKLEWIIFIKYIFVCFFLSFKIRLNNFLILSW